MKDRHQSTPMRVGARYRMPSGRYAELVAICPFEREFHFRHFDRPRSADDSTVVLSWAVAVRAEVQA
ncbi:hypothetical protein [Ralstonia syzygii]|uniref:hypothetical protein n=1 Tax=Ralstonia syzygii TaxID=28097 RepID=UPI0018D0A0DB|nr:hypothetical protein [Ralstonia syzygii]